MIRLGGRERRDGSLREIPVQSKSHGRAALSQQLDSLFVAHRGQRRAVHRHDFVTRSNSTVAQRWFPHQCPHVVTQSAAVRLPQSEAQTSADLCHLYVEFLLKERGEIANGKFSSLNRSKIAVLPFVQGRKSRDVDIFTGTRVSLVWETRRGGDLKVFRGNCCF